MACKRRSSVHHRSGKTVAFCGFVNIQSPNSPFKVPCTIYFSVVNRLCLKKWRAKDVLRSTTEVAKLLLSVGSSTFRVQILHSRFHAHFILVSSIGSAESNGVQNAFLGKPKIKVSFHKLSQKRLRLTIQCYMLSTKLRFWTTVVFGLAQFFFSTASLWTSNFTILCSWRQIYLRIRHVSGTEKWHKESLLSELMHCNWNAQDTQYHVLCQMRFLLQNNLLHARCTSSCLTRDGRRCLRPLPTCTYIGGMFWK